MNPSDEAARYSYSVSGVVADKPESVIAVVVTDEENEPAGILEKWSENEWIYADADSLEPLN